MKLTLSTVVLAVALAGGAEAACSDYTTYSQKAQGNPSSGPLALPYMRPECRTFNSTAVEKVITDMKSRLKDPDMARLFENTFPNTLDTTVKYFNAQQNLAFIITGDITAQWLRDTANQFAHYTALLPSDPSLATLDQQRGAIRREVSQKSTGGSFQPPPESGLKPSHNDWADGVTVNPPVDNQTVFECKYEIDSLCGFLKLSRSYYGATKDASFMNENCPLFISAIVLSLAADVPRNYRRFDADFNFVSYYNWTGGNGALSPAVPNAGNGEPKGYTGMVGTHHRPSDDISVFAFLTPANAMLSVELAHLSDVLTASGQASNSAEAAGFVDQANEWSKRVSDAVWNSTVVDNIFAYETNGFGGRYVMDDANVPSLLSLPYLGFLNKTDPAYVATRKLLLSRGNPYFAFPGSFVKVILQLRTLAVKFKPAMARIIGQALALIQTV
ncbi:Six-hairpin glycosidase-like protein [Mycena vitilis]|nr:Six-hairpin glycosidase-like protein [Mycena vitilis]